MNKQEKVTVAAGITLAVLVLGWLLVSFLLSN